MKENQKCLTYPLAARSSLAARTSPNFSAYPSCSQPQTQHSAPMMGEIPATLNNGCDSKGVAVMTEPNSSVFKTRRLPLAVWIDSSIGTHGLVFSHIEAVPGSHIVTFCFLDGNNEGAEVERSFDRGEASANIHSIYASQRFLRTQTHLALEKVRQ